MLWIASLVFDELFCVFYLFLQCSEGSAVVAFTTVARATARATTAASPVVSPVVSADSYGVFSISMTVVSSTVVSVIVASVAVASMAFLYVTKFSLLFKVVLAFFACIKVFEATIEAFLVRVPVCTTSGAFWFVVPL